MIKVTTKVSVLGDKGYETKFDIKEHKNGILAHVYNGVLTVYDKMPEEHTDLKFGIAGYMPDAWVSWEKAE